MNPRSLLRIASAIAIVMVATMGLVVPGRAIRENLSQSAPGAELPVVLIDALDPYRWSVSELVVAPGQTIRITNRGVMVHTFSVREWGVEVDLPTLEPVEVVVPDWVEPGEQFTFLCSEPGHQANGHEGVLTIVTPEEALARSTRSTATTVPRMVLETGDDFTWTPPSFDASSGQFIEVRNPGVLQHHFVVDEWDVNVTVSPGDVQLVQVPEDLEPGEVFTFYCSVPGHQALGMEGTITIVEPPQVEEGVSSGGPRPGVSNVERFLPEASVLGDGWSLVRTGNARAVLPDYDNVSPRVFPGEGRGATYVGPQGSRATVLILPFESSGVPTNQIEDAVLNVQLLLMSEWETDLRNSPALNQISPPSGCDIANRAAGVTRIYTLPAGSTVCQLRTAGIAIFVAIEGEYGDAIGVEAADELILRLLEGA